MYYCFVKEDLKNLSDSNPLFIQAGYAKRLGKYLCCDLEKQEIVNQYGHVQEIEEETIFLRATCCSMEKAIVLLERLGGKLFETYEAIQAIENWNQLLLTERKIFSITFKDILRNSFSNEIEEYLHEVPRVFVKSKSKGFCVKMPSERLLNLDDEIYAFLQTHCGDENDELMITEELTVKADSLGNKETRHFVFNGCIVNSSRTIHSLKHAVPKTLLEKAQEIVCKISEKKKFPSSYVLDLGLFEKDGEVIADIVEMNPITSSLCYINNSIFDEIVPEIKGFKDKWNIGAEYCYDALEHSERYVETRHTGVKYSYLNEEHYNFV